MTDDVARGSGGSAPTADELDALKAHFQARLPGDGELELAPLQQSAGNSHSIYSVDRGELRWILRVAPSADRTGADRAFDLTREASIIDSLRGSQVPHARVVLAAGDDRPTGRDFVVLESIDGQTLHGALPANCRSASDGAALAADIVDVLARIAEIDPGTVPVRFPSDSFWSAQDRKGRAMRSRFRTRPTPLIDELADRVTENRPSSERLGLVHGDYCPLNIMGTVAGPPRVAAVLDWETATVGDPLVDLAYLTARWVTPDVDPMMAAFTLGGGDPSAHALLPHWTVLADRYADTTGRDLADLPRYQGLAMLRLATALEGRVAAAARRGKEGMRTGFATMADTAARRGLTLMEG